MQSALEHFSANGGGGHLKNLRRSTQSSENNIRGFLLAPRTCAAVQNVAAGLFPCTMLHVRFV